MKFPTLETEELHRLETLQSFNILDTLPEAEFDEIALLASEICGTEIALISFVDRDRQWFKSTVGISATETPRKNSFCEHAIKSQQPIFEVRNALEDSRFKENLLVTGDPHIVFYAGAPMITRSGECIGTVCVIDSNVYELSDRQKRALTSLANQVVHILELRKASNTIGQLLKRESELRYLSEKNQSTLETMFETSSLGLAIVREPEFIFEKTNNAFRNLVSNRPYIGRRWTDVYPEVQDSILISGLTHVYHSGERFEQRNFAAQIENVNGIFETRYYDISFDRLDRDEHGNFSILIQCADITERFLSRQAIIQKEKVSSEAHEKLSRIIENVPVGLAIFEGEDLRGTFVNTTFKSYFDGTAKIGEPIVNEWESEETAELVRLAQMVYKTGFPYHAKTRQIISRDTAGRIRDGYYQFSCIPLNDLEGSRYGVALSAVDVTELTLSRNIASENSIRAALAESRVIQAVETAKVGFFEYDLSSGLIEFSPQIQSDWELPATSNLEEGLSRILIEDRGRVQKAVADSIANSTEFSEEYRVLRPSSQQIMWIAAKGRVIPAFNGQNPRFQGTTIDITSRKSAELESAAVADSIPQLAWATDSEGNALWYNKRWYEYTGLTYEDMEGLGWTKVHDSNHVERVVRHLQKSFRSGEVWEDTFPLRAKDGTYRWFLSRAEPIKDENGKIKKWFGTNTDITDQLTNERALTRMAAVIESSRDFIGMSDENFNVIYVNQGGRALTGFEGDATKVEIPQFFPKSEVSRLNNIVVPELLAKGYWEGEMLFQHFKTGALIPVLYNLFPIVDRKGVTIGYATVTRDITELKRNEQELTEAKFASEKASEAKSAFLANMSHEIRSPLGAIMGFSDLAKQNDSLPESVNEYLDVVHRNSVQVLKIVDDILDLAKVEAGKVLVELIDTNLISFLADFGSLMGFRARENGILFVLKAETDLPNRILIDPTRVRQVLTNAVGNAIKFTNYGSVTLHVCYVNGVLKFGITDTGRGITEEQASNLFQAFVQADDSTTRKFGGTGLGLILTRKLCQQMGGNFILERSELGVGSHFLATIAADTPQDFNFVTKQNIIFKSECRTNNEVSDLLLKGITILVVEDSPDNQALLKIILTKQGASFALAKDGLEGVAKAKALAYDIILMDVQMPNMDGHEAVREMRRIGIEKPVIALTAHAMKEEYDRAMKSGFTDYLTKPIDKILLIDKIKKLLKK